MQVFFVLAGFFACLLFERRGATGLLMNRLTRIGIPLVIGLLVLWPLIILAFHFAIGTTGGATVEGLGGNQKIPWQDLLVPKTTAHLWFLHYLLFYYAAAVAIAAACGLLPDSWKARIMQIFESVTGHPALRVVILTIISIIV